MKPLGDKARVLATYFVLTGGGTMLSFYGKVLAWTFWNVHQHIIDAFER